MAYIGRGLDKISNIEHLDTITFDGSSSYSLTKSSVAFTPNSAQSLIVSIDGVVQSNNFTVSGSTIDFGVAVPSTSTCDFIKHFGTGVAFTPADGTVGLNQLSATGTKDATTFLRGDNTFATAGGTNTPMFYGEKASDQTLTRATTTKITGFTSNEIDTDTAFDGTTFTVPSGKAGKYYIEFVLQFDWNGIGADGEGALTIIYKNGSEVQKNYYVDTGATTRQAFARATAVLDLSVADTVECYGNGYDGNGGGGGDVKATNSYMIGYKLVE